MRELGRTRLILLGALFLTAIGAVAFEGYSLIALFGIPAAITWYQ